MRFQNCLLTSKYPGTSRSMVVQCSAVTHDVSTESFWNIIVAHVHLFNIPLQLCMRTSTACFQLRSFEVCSQADASEQAEVCPSCPPWLTLQQMRGRCGAEKPHFLILLLSTELREVDTLVEPYSFLLLLQRTYHLWSTQLHQEEEEKYTYPQPPALVRESLCLY